MEGGRTHDFPNVHLSHIVVIKQPDHIFYFQKNVAICCLAPLRHSKEKRLKNHVISVSDVIVENVCMTLCYMEPNCVSYNFKTAGGENGNCECELNNCTHEGHETDLEEDSNHKYHGAKMRSIRIV